MKRIGLALASLLALCTGCLGRGGETAVFRSLSNFVSGSWGGLFGLALMLSASSGCFIPIEGFTTANPKRKIKVNPVTKSVEFSSNSNDSMEIKGFEVQTASGGSAKLESATFVADSAIVRAANVPQIDAMGRLATAHYEGWAVAATATLAGLADLAKEVAPIIAPMQAAKLAGAMKQMTLTLPGGIGFGSSVPPEVAQAVAGAIGALEKRAATAIPPAAPPGTQPAGMSDSEFNSRLEAINTIVDPVERKAALDTLTAEWRARLR